MTDTVGMAVLGCGRIGAMHAANIAAHPKTRLVAVHDIHAPTAAKVGSELGVQVYDDADGIFESRDVDAILIATATETHVGFIEQAVAAAKPVLCEKPIDLELARVNRCRDKIAGSGTPIQLGFNRRFDPGHRAFRDKLHTGEIGALRQLFITSRDPGMPPPGYCEVSGGIFRDMTIHDFDLARFLLGDEPVEVFAAGGRLIEPEFMNRIGDHDTAMITMRTASGVQCFISNSRVANYGYDQRVEALGSDGMLQSENRNPYSVRIYNADGVEAAQPYHHFFIERYSEAYMAEIGSFADCVLNGSEPEVDFEDGRMALVIAEAAYLSLKEERLVRIAEVDG